ncbi:MAG TPA: NAD(+) synthase [Candidatus Stercorousia faecigallinarum]|nr:NAD(+) synthase [Candidatus Stercorousia faecigallinarum]
MKTVLAQIKLKTADFKFNAENIINNAAKCDCDLIIFPQSDIEDLGGKDLVLDETCRKRQYEFYQEIADRNFKQNILIGDILIRNGEIEVSHNGFFDVNGKKVFVSDTYLEDVECDLYVLAKNRYFAKNTYMDFVDSIQTDCNLIYVNAIGIADENIFAGGSFAKNANNELVLQMPVCKEDIETVDFSRVIEFFDEADEAQILDVVTFALKEYCENTGFKKVVLGLSGGIDSALTAAIAVKALGADSVTGIMMPSMYSSEGSVTDSIKLAENLGIKTITEPITPLFNAFMQGRESLHDLAEENLQARLRGLILMFYSNRENMLLLSTGNKSESAMGFGTLYGDMAGGYNVICDLTKTNVYKLSNYINKDGEIIPQAIIDKAPSAELHPGQKDQDRLPEYAVLDDIIELYVEKNIPLDKIYEKFDKQLVNEVIRKICRMQFKRYQSCLGARLTERSFANGVNLPVVQKFY